MIYEYNLWRKIDIEKIKGVKMGVQYNITYKFKNKESLTEEDIKELFNRKFLKIIDYLESNAVKSN